MFTTSLFTIALQNKIVLNCLKITVLFTLFVKKLGKNFTRYRKAIFYSN